MPEIYSSWSKSRLKGAASICSMILTDIKPICKEIEKENKKIQEIQKILNVIINYKNKISLKLEEIETAQTRSLIDRAY